MKKPPRGRLAPPSFEAQSSRMIHPTIQLFEERALLLELQRSRAGLDDAIANLAAWMDLAGDRLTEDDWAVLGEIGGTLYREGVSRRRP
jgi:hypothetical protein